MGEVLTVNTPEEGKGGLPAVHFPVRPVNSAPRAPQCEKSATGRNDPVTSPKPT